MSTVQLRDRRHASERRNGGERRRQSDARQAALEVCRSTLHLALVVGQANGPDKLITRSMRWRREATSLYTELGVQELTAAFRTLASEERLAGAKIRIALSGAFCVTRVITGPTEEVRREFAELEERSHRYLTLGPGAKALSGSIQQLDARHQHALLAVANRKSLDLLMKIADSVNIHVESIEPSLVALSRAQDYLQNGCQEACLIIQLDEAGAELGICHRGRLLLDYRPGGETGAEHITDLTAQHLSRLQRYLDRYHAYLDAPLAHVYLTGEPAAVEQAERRFRQLPQLQTHVLDPNDLAANWQHAAAPPGTDQAAALGTALLSYPAADDQPGPNLIEGLLAELREPLRPILIRSLWPVAAMLLVAVGMLLLNLLERRETAAIRAELDLLNPARGRATELRLQRTAADAKLAQLHELQRRLPQPDWQRILSSITQSMPDDVWLERLSIRDGRSASLAGASYSDGGVYNFVSFLKEVPDLAEIALQSTGLGQSTTGPTTNFDLQVTLAEFDDQPSREASHD